MQEIMPELNETLQLLETERVSPETSNTRKEKIEKDLIPAANASLQGWLSILADYDATNEAAEQSSLENIGAWFLTRLEDRPNCTSQLCYYKEGKYDYPSTQYKCDPNDATPPISVVCKDFILREMCRKTEEDMAILNRTGKILNCTEWLPIPDDHPYYSVWEFNNPSIAKKEVTLAPKAWLDETKELQATKEITKQVTNIQSTGSIQFSGGGNILTLEFDEERMDQLANIWHNPLDYKANADEDSSVGVDGDGKVAVGMGALAGVIGGARMHYKHHVTHRMSTEEDTTDSTSIKVELGDPNQEDEFLIDMFLDPKYGTFVFVTIEGRSKCPQEKNTKPIEDPFIDVRARPNIVATDELMVFDIEIANHGYGESTFYLLSDKLENSAGLSISIDGANLNMFSPWRLKGTNYGGTSTISTLTIMKGPRQNVYGPVDIYLQSRCEFNGEFGSAKNSATLYNKVVALDENTTQHFIEFTPPCLEVQWAGEITREGRFLVNSNSPSLLDVTIFNPLYLKTKMVNIPRFTESGSPGKIVLEYKKVSDRFPEWVIGRNAIGGELDFLNAEEDSFGFATQQWTVPSIDAAYEIRLKSVCMPRLDTAPDRLNQYISDSLFGIVDRDPPSVYGLPSPLVNLHPGQDLTIKFTEDLDCELPYRFTVKMDVAGYNDPFNLDELDILCLSNSIRIQFIENRIPSNSYRALLGRDFNLTITGVEDRSGNRLTKYEFSSNFVCLPPNPKLTITHIPGKMRPYLPHEPIVFNAVIHNDKEEEEWSTSTLELGVNLTTNSADFAVLVNGHPLTDAQQYVLKGNETVNTEIALLKGPGKSMKFHPISLYLRSGCVQDIHETIQVTADLWNDEDEVTNEKFIKFTPPCPPIRWGGKMHQLSQNVFNFAALSDLGSLLEVTVFNEWYTDRKLFDRSIHNNLSRPEEQRLKEVILLYRRVGDSNSTNWKKGLLQDSNGSIADFSMESIEDNFGYATLFWNVGSVDESAYQVKVVSQCNHIMSDAHSDLDSFNTEVVQVVIDKSPPSVYGVPDLQLPNNFHPSHEFIIPFTEELYCEKPYVFDLALTFISRDNGQSRVLRNGNGIHVKCEGKDIKYRFDVIEMVGYSSLTNLDIKVKLAGVEDIARNVMNSTYEASYIQCDQTLAEERLYIGMGCDRYDNDCDLLVDECDEDRIPPVMTFPNVLKVETLLNSNNDTEHLVKGPICFSDVIVAREFLLANIEVSDDCSHEVRLNVQHDTDMSIDGLAAFRATATDERCEGGSGNHVHSEIFKVEIFDGYDTQGLLSDNTIVRGMGCDRADQNCDGIVDDCYEDLIPPIIHMSEAVTLAELPDHAGKKFVTSHCFDASADVKMFLEQNMHAEDDCAKDLNISIEEVISSHTWEKNHIYKLAEFVVTATDRRCGIGETWSVSRTFLVEVFNSYEQDVKQQGCNGFDENCDGVVDDCSEDRTSPVILFKEALTVSAYERADGLTIIDSPAFSSIDDAQHYLESILKAEDDCATALSISVSSPQIADCADTEFTVTVEDQRCSKSNPIQTVTRKFALKVDIAAPSVSIAFDPLLRAPHPTYYDEEGLYLHIDQNTYDFVNTGFYYSIVDNCPQEVMTQVKVLSNEFMYANTKTSGNMALIEERERRNDSRQSHRLQIFVEPLMCERNPTSGFLHSKPLCDWDLKTSPVRFYEIEVIATDYAGNVGQTSATVIILQKDYANIFRTAPGFGTSSFFINMVRQTPPQNVIRTKELLWNTSLGQQAQSTARTSSTGTTTTTTVAVVSSTLNVVGITPPENEDEKAKLLSTLEQSIIESLVTSLEPNQVISKIEILSIGGKEVRRKLYFDHRHLAVTEIKYTVSVTETCDVNCNGDMGSAILDQISNQLKEDVSSGHFSDILQELANENGVESLKSATVESVETSDNVSTTSVKQVNVAISGEVILVDADVSGLSKDDMHALIDALVGAIENVGCSGPAIESCTAKISSVNGEALHDQLFRRRLRKLQSPTSVFVYETLIKASCASTGCEDVQAIADALKDQITNAIQAAVESGNLLNSLRESLPKSTSEAILAMLADAIVTLESPVSSFATNGIPMQLSGGFYPDWDGKSGKCLNDNSAPEYMKLNPSWFHDSLESCCGQHYKEFYHICIGNTVGYYPNWEGGNTNNKCLSDAAQLPTYMRTANDFYQLSTIEECCKKFYSWDMDGCIVMSGGKLANLAQNEWYADWNKQACVQSCLKETGESQYGSAGLNCGGLAPPGETLFADAEDCCKKRFGWIQLDYCVKESKPPPSVANGTLKWYVNYELEKCVQDCSTEENKLAGINSCGGVVRDASVTLYDSPSLCCSEKFGWIPHELCVVQSVQSI